MDQQVQIVDSLFAPQQENPYTDRITAILQQKAQPVQNDPWQVNQAATAAMAGAGYNNGQGMQQILDAVINKPQQEAHDRALDSYKQLHDMFELKRLQGDKNAQSLFDKMNMFTGGDPEGNTLILNALHADPQKLDPHNAVQIYSKIGQIVNGAGYVSPEMQLNKLKPAKERAEIAKLNAEAKKAAKEAKGIGGASKVWQDAQNLVAASEGTDHPLDLLTAYSIAKSGVGQGLTIDGSGGVAPINGATASAESMAKAKKKGTVIGEGVGKSALALGSVEDNATRLKSEVQQLLSHPGKKAAIGFIGSNTPTVKGTDAYAFETRLKQINGGAFLDAYNTLRGSGAITDIEGEKATSAKQRMTTALNEKEFNAAAKDFLDVIDTGVKRARRQAAGDLQDPSGNPPAGGGTTNWVIKDGKLVPQ